MRIKKTKQINLHQLIEYVWENKISNSTFIGSYGASWTKFFVNHNGVISVNNVSPLSVFEISSEEELTEHTVFDEFHEYFWDLEDGVGVTEIITNESISGILEEHDEETVPLSITVRRRVDNEPVLIWSRDTGIPVEGVIEV